MSSYAEELKQIETPAFQEKLRLLYGGEEATLREQTARYQRMIRRHEELIASEKPLWMISAPGRAEIIGNHTDHNRGKVLAAAVNLDALAAVTPREDDMVRLYCEGFEPVELSLQDLSRRDSEVNTTAALARGVAFRMRELGCQIGGFDAVITSTVRVGSGLSSSAAIEVLLCAVFDALYNGNALTAESRAKISQFAENVYFGKPSGLLDQMASSVGGLCYMDFEKDEPEIQALQYDFAEKGYSLIVTATGGSHDDLTPDYAAIPTEMRAIAACFGKANLREIDAQDFLNAIPQIREKLRAEGLPADRALLRAWHFYSENDRVVRLCQALRADRLPEGLQIIRESGISSFCYLQNIYPNPLRQEQSLGLMMAETLLKEDGAWRIHGGGFAGTTLSFVPKAVQDEFIHRMEETFGQGACAILNVRPMGPCALRLN